MEAELSDKITSANVPSLPGNIYIYQFPSGEAMLAQKVILSMEDQGLVFGGSMN